MSEIIREDAGAQNMELGASESEAEQIGIKSPRNAAPR